MRILIITQIYAPEMGALANRMQPLARHLVQAGHEVSVATGMPNYPEGAVFAGYRGRRTMTERLDGVTVHRTASYTTPRNVGKWRQLRSYLSFIPAAYRSGLRAGPPDVILVSSPPIFPAVAAMALARRWGARLLFDIRDMWPDEIIACGAAREGSLPVKMIRAIERRVYRAADCVACTTEAFRETVLQRGVPPHKVLMAPNGADLERFRPAPRDNPVAAAEAFGDRFVVMYSGLLGIKHGLEALLDAADRLRDHEDVVFALVGTGPRREPLEREARRRGLTNVLFLGNRPLSDLPLLLARADVCVSTLLPDPYLEKIISVKIFEYMACERPVVIAQAGESARLVNESGGGIVTPPGDGPAIADAVLALRADESRARRMGAAGRRFVESHYARSVVARRIEHRMLRLVEEGGSRAIRREEDIPNAAVTRP